MSDSTGSFWKIKFPTKLIIYISKDIFESRVMINGLEKY